MLQQTQAARVVPYYERVPRALPGRGGARRGARARRARGLERARLQPPGAGAAARGARGRRARLARGPHRAARRRRLHRRRGRPRSPGTAQAAAVDTNVRRVISRHDGVRARAARARRARRASCCPRGRAATFNQAMMELGATVCRPRAPRCGECPVRAGCASRGPRPRRAARAARRERFEDTDRWARGRIVAALLAGEPPPELDRRASGASARWPGSSATA